MLTIRKASLLVLAALAGCAQIEVRNADAPLGQTVTTEDHNMNAALGWIPQVGQVNVRPGVKHWKRIRVIAPEGATECRSGWSATFGGPEFKGKPDAERAVMLTAPARSRSLSIVCDTRGGAVRRKIEALAYVHQPSAHPNRAKDWAWPKSYLLPPLVHLDPRDPGAEARWKTAAAEACPEISERVSNLTGYLCLPGMLDKLKAVDLGGPS